MSTMDPHEHYRELTALMALDALSPDEHAACAAHVASCAECAADLRAYRGVADALAHVPAQTPPPAALRERILSSVSLVDPRMEPARRPRTASRTTAVLWLATAASLAVAVLSAGYAVGLRSRLTSLEDQLREALARAEAGERQIVDLRRVSIEARAQIEDAQAQLVVLSAPDMARIDLTGQAAAPAAMARAFWSRARGLVFTASDLPALPAGRTYQLWVVTARAPISAGLVQPDTTGRVSAVFQTPPDIPPPVAMALTDEPEGGVSAPTGSRYLVGAARR